MGGRVNRVGIFDKTVAKITISFLLSDFFSALEKKVNGHSNSIFDNLSYLDWQKPTIDRTGPAFVPYFFFLNMAETCKSR